MKKLQDNFTTPEQSKRLIELGVPQDSADCYIVDWYIGGKGYNMYGEVHVPFVQYERKLRKTIWKENVGRIPEPIQNGNLPCWSVGRLMEIYDTCVENTESWPVVKQDISYVINTIVAIDCAVKEGRIDFSKLEE